MTMDCDSNRPRRRTAFLKYEGVDLGKTAMERARVHW